MLIQKSFLHPSVNIRFDLGRSEFFDRYLPTPSHTDALKGLLKGFLNKGSHAHIIIGPYGSGKSLITTIIGGIVSKSIDKQSYSKLLDRFKTVNEDSKIYEYLEQVSEQPIMFIPVVLNGNQGNLRRNLMASLYRTLAEYGFDFSLPSIAIEIEDIITMWKSNYIETYEALLREMEQTHWDIEKFLMDVRAFNPIAIDWFKIVYTQLTSGSVLSLAYEKDIVSQLQFVLKKLKLKGYGIFFVYDEFGRFMQTLDTLETHETMHDLQELAELANKDECQNLHIVFISHRNMRQYALKYENSDLEKEFQKIEERFNVYYTLTDHSTFVRLANVITEDLRRGAEFEDFVTQLRRFNLFEDLSLYEVDSLVIKGGYPLHPVTLFVMTHLANQVAQNERTLFTFLESDENGGLLYYYEKNKDWYRVDTLFDYFEPSISDFEVDTLVGQYYSLYQRLQRKLVVKKTRDDEVRVLKLLALWNIANLHMKQLPTEELIAFALSWDLSKVSLTLQYLHDKKVVRFNNKDNYWDLFEGSPIDTNQEIQNRQETINIGKRERMLVLKKILNNRHILAKRYNDEKSMTRFASIYPVFYSELLKEEVVVEELCSELDSDGVVIFVVNDLEDNEEKQIINLSLQEQRALFVTSQTPFDLVHHINKLVVVGELMQDKFFLSQDVYLKEELEKIYNDLVFTINYHVDPVDNISRNHWYYCGNKLKFNNEAQVGEKLSMIFSKIYYETPEFRNEAFNRRFITKIQHKSAIQVIDKILESNSTGDIEFVGNGPDTFIYKTIIKNTGINLEQPNLTRNTQLLQLREKLITILKQKKGKIEKLIDIFIEKPFGIRRPLIPLLLVSLLKTEWKHIMFYNNGVFNSEVNGELLFKMIENPEGYSFSYHPFEKKYEGLINSINEVFTDFVETSERSLHPAVYANRILLRWLRALPHITQNTNTLSDIALDFKRLIRRGEVEPDESLEEIYKLTNKDRGYLERVKNEYEQFYSKHRQLIEDKLFSSTGTTSYNELINWAKLLSPIVRYNNLLVKSLIESHGEDWIEEICLQMIGVKRDNWSDATDQLFINQINEYLNKLTEDSYQSFIEVSVGEEALVVPQVELSEKSRLIFKNLKQDVKLMGRTVPREEIQSLLLQLLRDFVKES